MAMCGQRHAPAASSLGTRPGRPIYCTGGWVGPRACVDGCGEHLLPPRGFDPRTVQPVASRYTDGAIPAH
jgi:hypothetical protein